jgi:phosphonate transport system ATP-binding protein
MAVLEIRDLRKTYVTGEQALKGVDVSVNARQVVAVLGLSGSGKSTLLRCINRLVEPDAGTVVLNGVEVTSLGRRELRRARRNMGMIFQEFNLVDRLTVLENVLSGRLGYTSTWRALTRAFPRNDIDQALQLCDRVGLIDHVRKRADQLSGGQRQRVGIARALMQEPKILLVDEPTSSLDPKIGSEIMELMANIAGEEDVPMLISVHDLGLARRYSDRIIGVQGGLKVLDEATPSVDDDIIESIYNVSVQAFSEASG